MNALKIVVVAVALLVSSGSVVESAPVAVGAPDVEGFLYCPEPDISAPVVAPNGALIKYS